MRPGRTFEAISAGPLGSTCFCGTPTRSGPARSVRDRSTIWPPSRQTRRSAPPGNPRRCRRRGAVASDGHRRPVQHRARHAGSDRPAWGIALAAFDTGSVAAADKLLVVGPSAVTAAIDAFSRGSDLNGTNRSSCSRPTRSSPARRDGGGAAQRKQADTVVWRYLLRRPARDAADRLARRQSLRPYLGRDARTGVVD